MLSLLAARYRTLLVWSGAASVLACSVDDRSVGVGSEQSRPGVEMLRDTSVASPAGAGVAGAGGNRATPATVGEAPGSSCGVVRPVVPSPLDLLIQLDSSASMLDALPAGAASPTVTTKWDAVRQAFGNFVSAPETADVGIGLSYFPQLGPAPASCSSNQECGGVGPCTNSVCVQSGTLAGMDGLPAIEYLSLAGNVTSYCAEDAECGPGASCRIITGQCIAPPGVLADLPGGSFLNVSSDPGVQVSPLCSAPEDCAGLPGTVCEEEGVCDTQLLSCTPSLACPAGAGSCVAFPHACVNRTRCDYSDYATPAVPIGLASLTAQSLVESLAARVPDGTTPTGPALAGALEHAQIWARQHPERELALVVLTDGFPTICTPVEIPQIGELAAAGLAGAWPVRTFVVGIFGSADLGVGGAERLGELAEAGGTQRAWLADTAGDVSRSVENALSAVRASASGCGLSLDADMVRDPEAVQLEFVDNEGTPHVLRRAEASRGCGEGADWYYVRDVIDVPVRIGLCPSVCTGPGSATSLQLRLACPENLSSKSVTTETRLPPSQ